MSNHGFARILLATDGSDQANAAVAVTSSFALPSSAEVRVVHVWNLEVHHRHGVWDVEMRREADELLAETVEKLRAAGIQAEGRIIRADAGHVAAAIAESAREFSADLVVVGSRGLPDWQAIIQHSTSHQLLGSVDAPVLIVRAPAPEPRHDSPRVLLAIAGGDDLVPGVRAAIAAATAPGAQVLVVHVAQAVVGIQGLAYVEPDEEIRETIDRASTLLKEAGIKFESMVLDDGPVAKAVAGIAGTWEADVIVVGGSRMGDLGSLMLGSVTHDLLRATARPILVAERVR
ncbi:MAG TPA: universal stress protein [Candidatus Dormibacteraeota bacterium]|nr:universal stress protein [Candidatus Dormibacteraeota bacterium]